MENIYGFVSPTGTLYACKKYGHMKLADELLTKLSLNGSGNTPEQLLACNGYMTVNQFLVGIDYYGDDYRQRKHLSEEQVEWISKNFEQFSKCQKQSVHIEMEY